LSGSALCPSSVNSDYYELIAVLNGSARVAPQANRHANLQQIEILVNNASRPKLESGALAGWSEAR